MDIIKINNLCGKQFTQKELYNSIANILGVESDVITLEFVSNVFELDKGYYKLKIQCKG
jgi:hypothetical protein